MSTRFMSRWYAPHARSSDTRRWVYPYPTCGSLPKVAISCRFLALCWAQDSVPPPNRPNERFTPHQLPALRRNVSPRVRRLRRQCPVHDRLRGVLSPDAGYRRCERGRRNRIPRRGGGMRSDVRTLRQPTTSFNNEALRFRSYFRPRVPVPCGSKAVRSSHGTRVSAATRMSRRDGYRPER